MFASATAMCSWLSASCFQRQEDEDNVAWARRRFAERILAVNPNYVDE
jgi:hypothetical protein